MEIVIEVKTVYGKNLVYPRDRTAQLFTELTGNKTLSKDDLERIELLGFQLQAVVFGGQLQAINSEAL